MNLQNPRLLATALVGLGVATPPPLSLGPHTGKPAVEAARADARSGDDGGHRTGRPGPFRRIFAAPV